MTFAVNKALEKTDSAVIHQTVVVVVAQYR